MKILTALKRVIDYNVRVRVAADESDVDLTGVKMSVNPFDEIALEEALRLREAKKAEEVIAVTIGPPSGAEQLRHALAMGADRAILVETEETLEPLGVARILAHLCKSESIGLALLGKQAIDDDFHQTGQMLAGLLGWPQATCASRVAIEGKTDIRVTREVDGGLEIVAADLPAVVTADLRLNHPRLASLPNIMKARKKPMTVIALKTLLEEAGFDARKRLRVLRVCEPPIRPKGEMLADVDALIEKLAANGVL